jgi:hypothetical protein
MSRAFSWWRTGGVLARGREERLKHCPIRSAVGMVHQDGEAAQINLRVVPLLARLSQTHQIRTMGSFHLAIFVCVISDQGHIA